MHNIELVKVLDARDDLMEKLQGLRLLDSLVLYDIVEKFTLA